MLETWLETIAKQGLLGALLLVEGFVIYKLALELKDSNNKRIEESNTNAKEKLALAEKVFEAIDKFSDLIKKNGGQDV